MSYYWYAMEYCVEGDEFDLCTARYRVTHASSKEKAMDIAAANHVSIFFGRIESFLFEDKAYARMAEWMQESTVAKREKDELYKAVMDALRENISLDEDEDGYFAYEIYADYRDEISDEDAIKICNSRSPWEALNNFIWDAYDSYADDCRDEVENDVRSKLEKIFPDGLTDEQESELTEILSEYIYFKYPFDHYLNQEIKTDIFVDTGDANYDFTLNCRYPAWGGESEDEIDPKASIRWLAETQGYSEPELRAALDEGDMANPHGFLETLRVELANTPSRIMCLVFLAEMKLQDLINLNEAIRKTRSEKGSIIYEPDLRPDVGEIVISKNAETGLYNDWDGGGGPFEIELEKDVTLPIKYIYSALPDGGQGKWSIDDTYGMRRSCWRDVVSLKPLEQAQMA